MSHVNQKSLKASDVNGVVKGLQNLNIHLATNREARKALLGAAPSTASRIGSPAKGTRTPAQRDSRSPSSSSKTSPQGGVKHQKGSGRDIVVTGGRDSDRGFFHPLVEKLNFGPTDHGPMKTITKNQINKARENMNTRRAALEHPYVNLSQTQYPVNYGEPAKKLNTFAETESIRMTPYGPGLLVTGREGLVSIASGSLTLDAGTSIFAFPLNPRIILSGRLNTYSDLYTRFIFKKFDLCYEHIAGTLKDGQLQMFYIQDPMLNPALYPGDGLVNLGDERRGTDFGLFEDAKLHVNDENFLDMLFVSADQDLRWTQQGTVYCVCSGDIAASITAGRFYFDYEVLLASDVVDPGVMYQTRTFRNKTVTFSTANAAGTKVYGLMSGAELIPPGRYFCSARSNASGTITKWYTDPNSYQVGDQQKLVVPQKGLGCWVIVLTPSSGTSNVTFYPECNLYEGNALILNENFVNDTTLPANVTMVFDFYALSFDA